MSLGRFTPQRLEQLMNILFLVKLLKFVLFFLAVSGVLVLATNSAYAVCSIDPNNPPVSCDNSIGTLDYPKTPDEIIPAPLKQMTLGIKLAHIICDDEHYPAWNVHYKPSCIFPDSEGSLLKRGWAKLRLLLPAGPDPIKELEITGQNEMSYRITGNLIYNDDVYPLANDRIRGIAWEYSQKYHPGEKFLEYSIPTVQTFNRIEEKVEFDLLEWGNYSDCWNLRLRIIDVQNNPVYEDNSTKYCQEPDALPGTFHKYSMGKDLEEFVCPRPGYYRIEVSNGEVFPPHILQNFVCLEYKPEPEPLLKTDPNPEKISDRRVTVKGEIADQICSITGGDCPSFYYGNPQSDGSIMIGITNSESGKEKRYMFLIRNDTLSYTIRENEN